MQDAVVAWFSTCGADWPGLFAFARFVSSFEAIKAAAFRAQLVDSFVRAQVGERMTAFGRVDRFAHAASLR